jgi:hypothetical protein
MAIRINKYADIKSFVAGASLIQQRELIGRVFTTNQLVPTDSFISFNNKKEVGDYFGIPSQEYSRAAFYFDFISKDFKSARKISFARWVDVDTAPQIYGSKFLTTLAQFQAITDGSFQLTLGAETNNLTGLDFSLSLSFADVASVIQASINAETGLQWTGATVSFNSIKTSFDFVGGDAVDAVVSVSAAGSGTDLVNLIGWGQLAIFSDGSLSQTITSTLEESANASNNFGSFCFIPDLSLTEIAEAAEWNKGENVLFQYHVPVSLANYASYSAALNLYNGTSLTISEITEEYPEMLPMSLLSATDYNGIDSVINYSYQIYNALTPSVSNTTLSDQLDAARVNYYGVTQESGAQIAFYQQGQLLGEDNSPKFMNTYANEQWLKDAATVAIMQLFLSTQKLSASTSGIAILNSTLQIVWNKALRNGTISVGKPLTDEQKSAIFNITFDDKAWYQVQNIGYWYSCSIILDGAIYKAVYTLIYSKDDDILKVEGEHILI